MDSPILTDELGPIRYDWPSIQLMFSTGVSPIDIARALTKDCPDSLETVRKTIAKRSQRYEWGKMVEEARKLISSHPDAISEVDRARSAVSPSVVQSAVNVYSERKSRYLEATTQFVDRAVGTLATRDVSSLEAAAVSAKLMEPIHKLAVDIHGLNAKDSPAALQVNFLGSNEACKVTVDVDTETTT